MGGCLLFQGVVSSTSFLLLSNKKNESILNCRSWGSRMNCRSWGSRMNCRSWGSRMNCRSGASRISSPWLILPPWDDDDTANMNFYSLEDNKVGSIKGGSGVAVDDVDHTKIVGSSLGWLALWNEISWEVFLWNPVSLQRINLPPLPISSSDSKWRVDKVIVCDAGGGKWRVVLSFGMHGMKGVALVICCPRHSDYWTQIPWPPHVDDTRISVYKDFAYSTKQNRLFLITRSGYVERWDLEDPSSPKIDGSNADEPLETRPHNMDTSYVVVAEHWNEVFFVGRKLMIPTGGETSDRLNYYKTVDFDVYELVDDGDGARNMRTASTSSLNGLVIFVGINHSFALPAAEFPELQTDSIYFTDDSFGGPDLGIYDYQNHSFSSCYYPNPNHVPARTRLTPSPFWFTPMSSN